MVGIVERQGREVQRERVVLMVQLEAVRVDHRTVGDDVAARLLSCAHINAVDAHTGDVHRELPLDGVEVGWLEPGNTLHTAEDQVSVVVGKRYTLRELIVLQSVVGEVVDGLTRLRVHLTQSVSGAHPYLTLGRYLDTCDILISQSRPFVIHLRLPCLQVVAVQSFTRSCPYPSLRILLDGVDLYVAYDTVGVEHVCPVVRGQVKTGQSDTGAHIQALAVGRQLELGDIVVHQTVAQTVAVGAQLRPVCPFLVGVQIHALQSAAHATNPQHVISSYHHVEHTLHLVLRRWQSVVGTAPLVNPSCTVAVGAHPEASLTVFGHAQHRYGGLTRLLQSEMPHVLVIGRYGIQTVVVAGHPQDSVAGPHHAHHAGVANGVLGAYLPTQVAEAVRTDGLHIHTLLQQTNPQVTALVL